MDYDLDIVEDKIGEKLSREIAIFTSEKGIQYQL